MLGSSQLLCKNWKKRRKLNNNLKQIVINHQTSTCSICWLWCHRMSRARWITMGNRNQYIWWAGADSGSKSRVNQHDKQQKRYYVDWKAFSLGPGLGREWNMINVGSSSFAFSLLSLSCVPQSGGRSNLIRWLHAHASALASQRHIFGVCFYFSLAPFSFFLCNQSRAITHH